VLQDKTYREKEISYEELWVVTN